MGLVMDWPTQLVKRVRDLFEEEKRQQGIADELAFTIGSIVYNEVLSGDRGVRGKGQVEKFAKVVGQTEQTVYNRIYLYRGAGELQTLRRFKATEKHHVRDYFMAIGRALQKKPDLLSFFLRSTLIELRITNEEGELDPEKLREVLRLVDFTRKELEWCPPVSETEFHPKFPKGTGSTEFRIVGKALRGRTPGHWQVEGSREQIEKFNKHWMMLLWQISELTGQKFDCDIKWEGKTVTQKRIALDFRPSGAEDAIRFTKAAAYRAELAAIGRTAKKNPKFDVYHADFRDLLTDLKVEANAILTDPLWHKEDVTDPYFFPEIAAYSRLIIASKGIVGIQIGQEFLPTVFEKLEPIFTAKDLPGSVLNWHWMMCYLVAMRKAGEDEKGDWFRPTTTNQIDHLHVVSGWKPLLMWRSGNPQHHHWTNSDIVISPYRAKALHWYQQSVAGYVDWIQKLQIPPKSLIVDPFTCSGSMGIAAMKCDCRFIGGDHNEERADMARGRISEYVKTGKDPGEDESWWKDFAKIED
jgi:hypothetical protein